MGTLQDPEQWSPTLPPNVVAALGSWLEGETYDLRHRGWFTDGRSGGPVARVVRSGRGHGARQVILKFSKVDHDERSANLRRAWQESPAAFQKHMAKVEPLTIPLEGWRAVFMEIAAGDLKAMESLSDAFDKDPEFPKSCSSIMRSVLKEWNEDTIEREDSKTVSSFLADIIGRRMGDVEKWLREAAGKTATSDRSERLPDPFELVTGEAGTRQISDLLTGKAHGDLSGRNILVSNAMPLDAGSYILIDYDRYSSHAPLTRDPMHLLVALALDKFEEFGPSLRQGLARVIVDPDAVDTPPNLRHFRLLCKEVHAISLEWASDHGWGSDWREQCLLSLVGVSLVHLGRQLRGDESAAKRWCYHLASIAAKAYLDVRPAAGGATAVSTASGNAEGEARRRRSLLDRHAELGNLRARLTDDAGGVVMVYGQRGIGKTALVDVALMELDSVTAPPRIHRYDINAVTQLDAHTLIDYVAGETDTAGPHRRVGSSLARLESTLRRLGHSPVVVAIDSAQHLADQTTRKLVDPEIDEVLEMLANEAEHRVTVVLVAQQELTSSADSVWPTVGAPIVVGRLPADQFFEYLRSLDRDGDLSVDGHSGQPREALYGRLRGNPRMAELVYAIIAGESGLDFLMLAERIRKQDTRDIPVFLMRLLIEGLTDVQQRVLEALAAFDTPVPVTAVAALVREFPEKTGRALERLAAIHAVYRVEPDQFFVPPEDGHLILGHLPDDRARAKLYFDAATVLSDFRIADPCTLRDLRVHFAELTALLRSEKPPVAYSMIEAIDEVLRGWSCSPLLRTQRESVRGKLGDDHLEMANENALGDIYRSQAEFRLANDAYGRALKIAQVREDETLEVQIYVNMAVMAWGWHETDRAFGYFERARDEAERLNNRMVLMAAIEGLADCHRRQGRYRQAMERADEALAVPRLADYPHTAKEQNFAIARTVAIALKVAHWHGELGGVGDAAHFIEIAYEAAGQRDDLSLLASCHDGRASMLLDGGDRAGAESAAQAAIEQGLLFHDPVTLVQARTTLCLAYLMSDRIRDAEYEIRLAWLYRRDCPSLIVLALLALVTQQKENHPEAGQLFQRLLGKANERIERDPEDFAAYDFKGFALCGLGLESDDDLDEPIAAFRRARSLSPSTWGLVGRLRFLLKLLSRYGRRPERLRPAIDLLGDPNEWLA